MLGFNHAGFLPAALLTRSPALCFPYSRHLGPSGLLTMLQLLAQLFPCPFAVGRLRALALASHLDPRGTMQEPNRRAGLVDLNALRNLTARLNPPPLRAAEWTLGCVASAFADGEVGSPFSAVQPADRKYSHRLRATICHPRSPRRVLPTAEVLIQWKLPESSSIHMLVGISGRKERLRPDLLAFQNSQRHFYYCKTWHQSHYLLANLAKAAFSRFKAQKTPCLCFSAPLTQRVLGRFLERWRLEGCEKSR